MTMPPCTPHPAAQSRIGGLTALLGLGLVAALALEARGGATATAPTAPEIASDGPVQAIHTVMTPRPPEPSLDAADLVGIYRAGGCTLTLDASGTYTERGCGDGRAHPYAIEGNQVVLRDVRLVAAGRGRLVSAAGATFTITGGVR